MLQEMVGYPRTLEVTRDVCSKQCGQNRRKTFYSEINKLKRMAMGVASCFLTF